MAPAKRQSTTGHGRPAHPARIRVEHLEQMLAVSPAVVYRLGPAPDYATTDVGDNVLKYIGYAPADFYADPFLWTKLLHPDDSERILELLSHVEQVERLTYEYRLRHRDGHYVWLHDQLTAICEPDGKVSTVVGCWVDVTERKRSEALLEGQNRVLAGLVKGATLSDVLADLATTIEAFAPDVFCSICLYDEVSQRLHLGAAPSLPESFVAAMDGMEIGPRAGSCGTAAYRRERVIVEDTQKDPLWSDYRQLAAEHKLRAGWSQPVLGSSGRILGVFGMYYDTPRAPTQSELELIERSANLAAIAIQHKREEAADKQRARLVEFAADMQEILGQEKPLAEILQQCAKATVRHFDAALARIWTLSESAGMLELRASAGRYTHLDGPHSRIRLGHLKIGQIALERKPHLTNRVIGDPRIDDQAWAQREGMVAFAGCPLVIEDRTLGVIAMFCRKPLTPESEQAMTTVADIIAAGIARRRVEDVLRRSERLASIGTLAAGIAHEVNNPLTAILLAAERVLSLRAGRLRRNDVEQCLRGIIEDAHRCDRIIKGVLRFAIDGTSEQWSNDLAAIVRGAVKLTRGYAGQHGKYLELELDGEALAVVVNPGQIEQVLVNLIRNAVEASGDGRIVTVSTARGPAVARVQVRDEGCGIAPDRLNRVFDPFFTTREREGGTGLGLSIAHGIAKLHGGLIDIDSEPGRGTTVTMELPLAEKIAEPGQQLGDENVDERHASAKPKPRE